MKATYLAIAGFSLLGLFSCKEEKEKPKVSYDTPKVKIEVPKPDTTSVEIADLPIQITGTDYLIHPIGNMRSYERSGNMSYTISNYGEFEIAGFLTNLKFQKTDSDSLAVLTDKPVLIQTATYLKAFADKGRPQIIAYTLSDIDTNKDGKIDASDIKTLYLSTISGENFTKVSADFQELIDWKLIESKNRLYFRTIEDSNKNGEFDKDDAVHYNYVELGAKSWETTPYKPL